MFVNTDQYFAASLACFDAQRTAFGALTTIAIQAVEKIGALNMAAASASAEHLSASARDLLATNDPQAFFMLATAYAKPDAEKVVAYGRRLTDIVASTKTEFGKAAEAQVAVVQSNVSAMVDGLAKSAPAGSENVIALLKSSVENAQSSYEQVSKATKLAVKAGEVNVANASQQFSKVVKKAAAK